MLPLLIAACDFSQVKNPLDDFRVIVELEPINTTVAGQVINVATGQLVNREVTFTFEGDNAGDLIDTYSDPITEAKFAGGLVSFGVRNEVVPSSDSPIEFWVVARAQGYQPTRMKVRLENEGDNSFALYMRRKEEPPATGTATTQQAAGQTDQSGAVTTDVSVSTPPENQTQATASVGITQGTVATTSAGTPASGRLTATMTYFNNQDEAALQALPGGSVTQLSSNGTVKTTGMVTAGFVDIDVKDAGGNEITQFSQPVTISMEIPDGTVNLSTQQPLQAGDKIKVYSFDEERVLWVEEGEAIVEEVPGGKGAARKWRVAHKATHLSTWNFGWDAADLFCGTGGTVVFQNRADIKSGISFVVTGGGEGSSGGFSLSFTLPRGTDTNGNGTIDSNEMPDRFTLANVPKFALKLRATTPGVDTNPEPFNIPNPCNAGTVTVPLTRTAANLTIRGAVSCDKNPTRERPVVSAIPGASLFYKEKGVPSARFTQVGIRMLDVDNDGLLDFGEADVLAEVGKAYQYYLQFGSKDPSALEEYTVLNANISNGRIDREIKLSEWLEAQDYADVCQVPLGD